MEGKEQTPPPTTAAATSSPMTPNPKRSRISSPGHIVEKSEESSKKEDKADQELVGTERAEVQQSSSAENDIAPEAATTEDEDELEADDDYADSAFGTDNSDTTSVSSSIYQGMIENGRRYQTRREGEYYAPADEKQLLSMEAGHVVNLLLDTGAKNPLFFSPIPDSAQNILDIGTGSGIWCKDVADRYPSALVQGIDLSPPTDTWMPPNCKLEVDDALKPWQFQENGQFNLVHMRDMLGSFTDEQWRLVYKQAYNNLAPGGWIEQIETSIEVSCDDGTLAENSVLGNMGKMFYPLFEKMGKPMDTFHHFERRIKAGGFINVHEKMYKCPLGDWPKDPVMKEAGRFCKIQLQEGMEGYVMFVLTRFGDPTPWAADEVQVFLAKMRQEVNNPAIHGYYRKRRVWAQKPYDKAE